MIRIDEFTAFIYAMKEAEPKKDDEFKQLMGIISGNKNCLEKATLEDILYLLDNLKEILDAELQMGYPEIDLRSIQGCSMAMRRAV